jgi:prepilin peptidase dependent protein B
MLEQRYFPRYFGFSMVEMMVALLIFSMVMMGILSTFLAFHRSNHDNSNMLRLDYQLRTVIRLITSDLRRAGYWGDARSIINSGSNTNPFMANDTNIYVNGARNCILFTYDYRNTGHLPALNDPAGDDRFAYRLSKNTLQARPSYAPNFSCNDDEASWNNLTDPDLINITEFNITPHLMVIHLTGTATLTIRTYTITISGELYNDPSVKRTVSDQIRVRNDFFTP